MPTKNKDIDSVVSNNMANLVNSRANMEASSPSKQPKEYNSVKRGSAIPPPAGSSNKQPLYPTFGADSDDDSGEFDFKTPATTGNQKKPPPGSSNNHLLPLAPGGDYEDEMQKKMPATTSSPPRKMTMEEKIQAKIQADNANRIKPQQQLVQEGESFLTRPDRIQAINEKGGAKGAMANTGTSTPGVQFYSDPTPRSDGPLAQVETVQTARPQETATEVKHTHEDQVSYYIKYGAIGLALLVVVVLIVVLVTVLGGGKSDSNEVGPGETQAAGETRPPTANELLVLDWLPQSTRTAVERGGTPQAQAFSWLTSDESLADRNYTQKQLKQRYAMATFYYATGGQSWKNNNLWLSQEDHECQWFSNFEEFDEGQFPCGQTVSANTQHYGLQYLSLSENNLVGELPPEISWLSDLISISLNVNELKGKIPPSLGDLSQLAEIDFTDNALTGPIPNTLGALPKLAKLVLEFNELTGTVPRDLAIAPLVLLIINNNDLVGRVPGELCEEARVFSDCSPTFCSCDACEFC